MLPLELAKRINKYDVGLYRFCCALSQQFTRRFFNLHDLDFKELAIKTVSGFPGTVGSPRVILVIQAAGLGQELPEPIVPDKETYGEFE